MTNNQNFKKGDRVRYIGEDNDLGYDLPLCNGGVYVVAKANDSEVDLETPYIFPDVDINDVELVEPYDRRTAFLTRLQSLLREFDAAIEPEYSSYSEVGIVSIIVGSECVVESYDSITADNIMEFDKE